MTMEASYQEFAQVYDTLMDDYDYEAWSRYYLSLLADVMQARRPWRVAECACGTGNLTIPLARAGLRVTGIDASLPMLRVAERKAREAGVNVSFVHQNMKALTLGHRADAVLCTCDGLNYLTGEGDAAAFFCAAFRALRPGGALCFDVSSRYKLEHILGDGLLGEERDGIAYLWKNTWHAGSRQSLMDITFFVREPDGRYRRFREQHRQRAYEPEELSQMLEEAGFRVVGIYGEMHRSAPEAEDLRIHFVAVKPCD